MTGTFLVALVFDQRGLIPAAASRAWMLGLGSPVVAAELSVWASRSSVTAVPAAEVVAAA